MSKHYRIFLCMLLLSSSVILLTNCHKKALGNDNDTGIKKSDTTSYDLINFPKGSQPKEVGIKLTERFIGTKHSYWGNMNSTNTADLITYPDVCAWLGALWFTKSIGNSNLNNQLVDKFDLLFNKEKNLQPTLNPTASNKVDYYVFGAVPLEIYRTLKESKYMDLGLRYADGQWTLPSNASQSEKDWQNRNFSWQTRLWIDDMFMITALQSHAYLATKDEKYIERTAKEMVLYLDELQRDNGLFYHAPSAPFYWGRGNGWMAVGMTEVLRMLPQDSRYNIYRTRIKEGYLRMMASLLKYQFSDGMWGQLIDDSSSWKETSGTAMFTYAMISGVKNGWLDNKTYGTAARKAWLSLITYLDSNNDIQNVCEGTGEKNDHQYYLDRKKLTGDLHGQAALLWCAYALSRPAEKN